MAKPPGRRENRAREARLFWGGFPERTGPSRAADRQGRRGDGVEPEKRLAAVYELGGIVCRVSDAACAAAESEEARRVREELERAAGEILWNGQRAGRAGQGEPE